MRLRTFFWAAGAAALITLALLLRAFSASPLPKPEPYMGSLPSGTPPKEMAVVSVLTGVNHRVAGFGYRGGSLFERREFSMAGTLVKHPQGDLLVAAGTGLGPNLVRLHGRRGVRFSVRFVTKRTV